MVSVATAKPTDAAASPPLPCLSVSPLQVEARDRDSARQQKAEKYDTDPAQGPQLFNIK